MGYTCFSKVTCHRASVNQIFICPIYFSTCPNLHSNQHWYSKNLECYQKREHINFDLALIFFTWPYVCFQKTFHSHTIVWHPKANVIFLLGYCLTFIHSYSKVCSEIFVCITKYKTTITTIIIIIIIIIIIKKHFSVTFHNNNLQDESISLWNTVDSITL